LGEGENNKEMEEKESVIAELMKTLDNRNNQISELTLQLSKLKTPTRRVTEAFGKEVKKRREEGVIFCSCP
jgi:predicted  nucleic acid-binding Zn-ribbon protein